MPFHRREPKADERTESRRLWGRQRIVRKMGKSLADNERLRARRADEDDDRFAADLTEYADLGFDLNN